MESRERNEGNDKKELKNYVFQFHVNIRKIRTNVGNGLGGDFDCSSKGRSEN